MLGIGAFQLPSGHPPTRARRSTARWRQQMATNSSPVSSICYGWGGEAYREPRRLVRMSSKADRRPREVRVELRPVEGLSSRRFRPHTSPRSGSPTNPPRGKSVSRPGAAEEFLCHAAYDESSHLRVAKGVRPSRRSIARLVGPWVRHRRRRLDGWGDGSSKEPVIGRGAVLSPVGRGSRLGALAFLPQGLIWRIVASVDSRFLIVDQHLPSRSAHRLQKICLTLSARSFHNDAVELQTIGS
jgi:hypothetical protein